MMNWAQRILIMIISGWACLPVIAQNSINVKVATSEVRLSRTLANLAIHSQRGQLAQYRSADPLFAGLTAVQSLQSSKKRIAGQLNDIYTLEFTTGGTERIANLMASGKFEWVEPNRLTSVHTDPLPPNDPQIEDQWFHDYIRTFQAWETTRGSNQVVIGILDTGLDYDHPEFEGQLAINTAEDANGNGKLDAWPDSVVQNGVSGDFDGVDDDGNGFIDDVIGYDFTDQPRSPFGGDYLFPDPNPLDDNNHGTLVAGLVGAKADNNLGIAGVAPGCKMMVLRAFSANGSGEDDDIARAIIYAADNGVQVLNFSFGDIYPSKIMHEAIRYAYARGVVMVGSAGNGTGDEVHYPSGYNEVISVSATDVSGSTGNEILWPLSSYGLTVDLAAPGSGLLTTVIRDSTGVPAFDFFSGTSTSAPLVAGTAALLLSQRGACSPQQIRGILTGSADDVGEAGWDHFTGAGRLNMEAALAYVGASNVQILAPLHDGGAFADSVWVKGTVLDPQFSAWHLEFQAGEEGQSGWTEILAGQTRQKSQDTLGLWRIANLSEGTYTLRLRLDKTDGSTQEDRIRFWVDRTAPTVEIKLADKAWDNEEEKLFMVFRASDVGNSWLHFRQGTGGYQAISFDRGTKNGSFLLGGDLLQDGPVEFYVRSRNAAGLEGQSAPQTLNYQRKFIPTYGYDTTGATLPMGQYLPTPTDFDNDGQLEVVMSRYSDNLSFGSTHFYEYNPGFFTDVDSITLKSILIPKDVADVDGNGSVELLASVNDTFYVFQSPTPQSFPTQTIYQNQGQGYYAARFGDTDTDGELEIVAKDFEDYFIFEKQANAWALADSLRDITPGYEGSIAPRALVNDFDANGRNEVVFGDFDGDLLIYEWNGSDYLPVFQDTTNLKKGGSYLLEGDFDGDGQPEIFSAVHTSLLRNSDFEYDPGYWWLRIFEANAPGNYQVTYQTYLFDIDTEGFNGATAGDLDADGDDEIIFSTFPRTYILNYAAGAYDFEWFHYGGLCTHHVVGDFNGNGHNEFALGRGDIAFFYEKNTSQTGPSAPLGLDGQVRSSTSTSLFWQGVADATDGYYIWRGEFVSLSSVQIALIDSVPQTTYMDTGLTPGQDYLYVVQSKNSTLSPAASEFSNFVVLRPHAPGRLNAALPVNDAQVELFFSVPVTDAPEQLPFITLDSTSLPIALIGSGSPANSFKVAFSDPLTPGPHTITIDSLFMDAYASVLDPNFLSAVFFIQPDTVVPVFLTHWETLSDKEAILHFSEEMQVSALDAGNYSLAPYGNIEEIAWLDAGHQSVRIALRDVNLGALGNPLSIIAGPGILSVRGAPMNEKEGNVATFTSFAADLSGVYVYPNPVEPNAFFEGLRFAGLPREATIQVISVTGRHIIHLAESDGDGGLTWDMHDEGGKKIKPGKYIFRVETPEGEVFLGKFALLDR